MRHFSLKWLLISPVLGMVAGWFCASVILSFGALIGKSGSTGEEYVGFWSPWLMLLGVMYGAPIGAICLSVMYVLFLADIEVNILQEQIWKIALATIIGGCIGSGFNPFYAVGLGVVFFASACLFVWYFYRG